MAFAYFTSETSENFTFFRIPKVFFKDEKLKKLSTDAKVLYGLMLDRTGLSLKNKWFDAAGRVFIYYSVTNMQDDLGLSNKTICKCVKELKEIGLVRVKRQGLTKQNIIYVLDFSRQIPELRKIIFRISQQITLPAAPRISQWIVLWILLVLRTSLLLPE